MNDPSGSGQGRLGRFHGATEGSLQRSYGAARGKLSTVSSEAAEGALSSRLGGQRALPQGANRSDRQSHYQFPSGSWKRCPLEALRSRHGWTARHACHGDCVANHTGVPLRGRLGASGCSARRNACGNGTQADDVLLSEGGVGSQVRQLPSGRRGANHLAIGTFGSAGRVGGAWPIFGKRGVVLASIAVFAVKVWLVLGPASPFGVTRRSGFGRGRDPVPQRLRRRNG